MKEGANVRCLENEERAANKRLVCETKTEAKGACMAWYPKKVPPKKGSKKGKKEKETHLVDRPLRKQQNIKRFASGRKRTNVHEKEGHSRLIALSSKR